MKSAVNLYVRFKGKQRLLRLVYDQGQWHGALKVPGEVDMFDEYVERAPRGATLPTIELKGHDLRIEHPETMC